MHPTITFYIARHGKTMMNTLDKVQGWCDSPLTPEGIQVARYLGAGLKEIEFDSIYTSDLRRTRQTAETILAEQGQTNLPITEMFGFREACFGSYEADHNHRMWKDAALFLGYTNADKMYQDVFGGKINHKEILNAIQKLDHMGLAETYEQIEKRTQSALYQIAEQAVSLKRNQNILVVAHGMSIIALLCGLGGDKLLNSPLLNASICKVEYHAGCFTVQSMGDMQYVEQGQKIATM